MPDPYSLVDTLIKEQLQGFTALTDLLPANRIRFADRPTDIRKWLESEDAQTTMFVYPGRSPQSPFANVQAHDQSIIYELVIDTPDTLMATVNAIRWQVYRAFELFMDLKDADGNALTQPAPFNLGHSVFRDFRMDVRQGNNRIQFFGEFEVSLMADKAGIRGGDVAPTFKELRICRNDSDSKAWLFMHFNQQMARIANADLLMEVRDGAGNTWTVVPPAVCQGGSVAMVELSYPPASEAGVGMIKTYGGGTPKLANINDTAVADVSNQAIKVTVISDA